jgi:cytoskeleton protein RodZ
VHEPGGQRPGQDRAGYDRAGAAGVADDHRSFGSAVRAAREAAGLSIEQVSERTRIRTVVLSDLEQGSTVRSGGDVYARGHLKAIAAATGTDPAVLLAAQEQALADARPEGGLDDALTAGPLTGGSHAVGWRAVGSRPAASQEKGRRGTAGLGLPTPTRERGGPRWGAALVAATGVLAVLLLAGVWSEDDPPVVEPALGVAAPAQPPVPPGVPAAPATPATAAPGSALRLQVGESSSWVQVVTATGQELFQGELPAGTAREFTDAQPLKVVVGNAAAVTVACGGTDAAPGRRGQVRRWTCASGGLAPA